MPKLKTIDRIDFVRINTDFDLTAADIEMLNNCSKKTACSVHKVPFQPRWTHVVEGRQPKKAWFQKIDRMNKCDAAHEISYVEIARDFLVRTRVEAERMHSYFLGTVRRPYERKPATDANGTSYYGSRRNPTGTLVVYSDRGYKPAGGFGLPCLHVEMRLANLPLILENGLVSVQDVVDFDYDAFWAKKLHCVDLPSKTVFGRLLGRLGDTAVQDQAYRKRANKLFKDKLPAFHFPRGFVLHNAAINYPRLRRLPSITFVEWEELARDAALMPIKIGH